MRKQFIREGEVSKNTTAKRVPNLDTSYKVRSLLRKIIQLQLNKEISTNQHSAINGSIGLVLKTLEMKSYYEREMEFRKDHKRLMDGE